MDDVAVCHRCRIEYDPSEAGCPNCGCPAPVKGRVRIVLRWLAMLPAAVLASGAVALLIDIELGFFPQWNSLASVRLVQLFGAGIMGYCFVLVGSLVAPRMRAAIPLVLACVYGAVVVLGVYAVTKSEHLGLEGSDEWQVIWMGVVSIATAFVVAIRRRFHRS